MKRDFTELLAKSEKARELVRINKEALEAEGASWELVPNEMRALKDVMDHANSYFAFIGGETGTGKSFGCRVFGNVDGAPQLIVRCNPSTKEKDLFGEFVPDESGKGLLKFAPGPVIEAMVEGYDVILDEWSNVQPEIQVSMNPVADETPFFSYKGKIFSKHKNFRVYATGNPGYAASSEFQLALKNRLTGVVVLPPMDEGRFVSFMKKKRPWLNKEFYSVLFKTHIALEDLAKSHDFREKVKFSVRNAQGFADQLREPDLSRDQFRNIFKILYTNFLSLDNNNAAKIPGAVKATAPNVDKLFELYKDSMKAAGKGGDPEPAPKADEAHAGATDDELSEALDFLGKVC